MHESEITVATPSGPMRAFVARPEGDVEPPLALLSPDGPGYRAELKDMAKRFAADGYCCVVPDWTSPLGEPLDLTGDLALVIPELYRRITALLRNDGEMLVASAGVLLDHVDTLGIAATSRVVSVGYCWGASAVVELALAFPDRVRAALGFHPFWLQPDGTLSPKLDERPDGAGPSLPSWGSRLADARSELYVGFAENDPWISESDRAGAIASLEAAGATAETYAGTTHGFAVVGGRMSDAAAIEKHFDVTLTSWRRALAN